MAVTAYCTQTDVEDLLSVNGVLARADDDADGGIDALSAESRGVTQALEWGTLEINKYLLRRYTVAQLATADLIKYFAVTLAAVRLCKRRGNPVPDALVEESELVYQQLTDIRDGKLDVPSGVLGGGLLPERAADVPTAINQRADPRYGYPLRRQDKQSSKRTTTKPTGRDWFDANRQDLP